MHPLAKIIRKHHQSAQSESGAAGEIEAMRSVTPKNFDERIGGAESLK